MSSIMAGLADKIAGKSAKEAAAIMMAMLAEQEEQIAKLSKAAKAGAIRKSDKGGVSVYGLGGRFPITLYRNQWEKLFDLIPDIKAFIEAHADELAKPKDKDEE